MAPWTEVVAEVDHVNRGRATSIGMDGPFDMSSLLRSPIRVADDRRRWAAITAEASVGVPQPRLGVTGFD